MSLVPLAGSTFSFFSFFSLGSPAAPSFLGDDEGFLDVGSGWYESPSESDMVWVVRWGGGRWRGDGELDARARRRESRGRHAVGKMGGSISREEMIPIDRGEPDKAYAHGYANEEKGETNSDPYPTLALSFPSLVSLIILSVSIAHTPSALFSIPTHTASPISSTPSIPISTDLPRLSRSGPSSSSWPINSREMASFCATNIDMALLLSPLLRAIEKAWLTTKS